MSSLIVEVKFIDEIRPHTNAENLELAIIGGWQCVVPKNRYAANSKVAYIPPDTILPGYVSDSLNITNYLSNGKVKSVKLRGEPSFGLILDAKEEWKEGDNVASYFGATKYEPVPRATIGDADAEHVGFPKYTDIENMRHYLNVFSEGEPVWITEKIHGTSSRVGIINGVRMAGSHRVRRKCPEDYNTNIYWKPWLVAGVKECIEDLSQGYQSVIMYGEIYGKGIQNFHYDAVNTQKFAVFDIKVGGKYLDPTSLEELAERYGFPVVPHLFTLPYSLEVVKAASSGKSTLGDHIREGVVVRPLLERDHPKIGRVVLKYVNDEYLVNQGKYSDFTDLVNVL